MWNPFKREKRAGIGEVGSDNLTAELIRALIGTDTVTKEMAKQIPSINACIKLTQNVISSLDFKLYETTEDGAKEVKDERVKLFNRDTKGTLSGTQLKKAIVDNYMLGKGAYIFIEKAGTKFKSLRFVENEDINAYWNEDPIFKKYHFNVLGKTYFPYEFIKIMRDTTDGFTGHSIIDENPLMLAVAYNSLAFENRLVKKGGNKKGFLQSEKKISDEAMKAVKKAWSRLYSNDGDNVVILNDGLKFQESSNTSVEMQLNENKRTNSEECSMLFIIGNKMIRGNASTEDISNFTKWCIIPIIRDIEDALDRDFLLEKEKDNRYWKCDTTELNRGSIKERYDAYKTAIDSGFLLVDEVREKEDLNEVGFKYVKLGLDSVLYDPKTDSIYTPNTNEWHKMGEQIEQKDEKGGENKNEN